MSITLGLFALTIAVVVGVGVGTLAAVQRGGPFDWLSLAVALVGISLPSFVTAARAAARLRRQAATGSRSAGGARLRDMVLPGLALSLVPMAYIARLTRVSMIDVLGSDYVRTARAKGLSRVDRHLEALPAQRVPAGASATSAPPRRAR